MREILFRGKRVDNGEWVYGSFIPLLSKDTKQDVGGIKDDTIYRQVHLCELETVGQYTGLTDKNGTKIFEGDIVKAQDNITLSPFCDGITGVVVYDETSFFLEPERVEESQNLFNECAEYEVLGNKYDNPELLKEREGNG